MTKWLALHCWSASTRLTQVISISDTAAQVVAARKVLRGTVESLIRNTREEEARAAAAKPPNGSPAASAGIAHANGSTAHSNGAVANGAALVRCNDVRIVFGAFIVRVDAMSFNSASGYRADPMHASGAAVQS